MTTAAELGSPGEAEERAVAREPAAQGGAWTFQVVDAGGGGVPGALCSVSPNTNDVLGYFYQLDNTHLLYRLEERTGRILRGRRLAIASEGGRVAVELQGMDGDLGGWVAWVTSPDHGPSMIVGDGSESDGLARRVELAEGGGAAVRVVDSLGEAIVGARVVQQAVLTNDGGDPNDFDRNRRRALVREFVSDGEGRAALHGMGTAIVWAEMGPARSEAAEVRDGENVELLLGEMFELSCELENIGSAELGEWAVVSVSTMGSDGRERLLHAISCPEAGFKGQALPVVEGVSEYVARLSLGENEASVRRFSPPRAGATVDLAFEVRPGIPFWFAVHEWSLPDAPIVDAEVRVRWQRETGPVEVLAITDRDGNARIQGLPLETAVVPHVSAEGFQSTDMQALVLDAEDLDQGVAFGLDRVGKLRVRVTDQGVPLEQCSFAIWDQWRVSAPHLTKELVAVDGWFTVFDVTSYVGSIVAVTAGAPISHPVPLDFSDVGQVPEIEIEASRLLPLRGRIVHAETGVPLEGVGIWLESASERGTPVFVGDEVARSGADGGFEATYPESEAAWVFAFSDEGEELSKQARATVSADGAFEFGDIALEGTIGVRVELTSVDGDPKWGEYRVTWGKHTNSGIVSMLDADGGAWLDVQRGAAAFTVRSPAGDSVAFSGPAIWEAERVLRAPLHTESSMWIKLLDESGQRIDPEVPFVLQYESAGFQVSAVVNGVNGVRGAELPLPLGGSVDVTWMDGGDPARVAVGRFDLADAADTTYTMRTTTSDPTVLIEDKSGRPLQDVFILVCSERGGAKAFGPRSNKTDTKGVARMFGLPERPRGLMHGPGDSFAEAPSIIAGLATDGHQVWTFDAPHALSLRILDGDAPVDRARAQLWHGFVPSPLAAFETQADGALYRDRLGAGAWRVVVQKAGHWTTELEVELPALTAELQLRRLGSLEVTLRTAQGEVPPASNVVLEHLELGTSSLDWTAAGRIDAGQLRSDSLGVAHIANIPWGRYRIMLSDGAGAAEVRVEPGELARATLIVD